MPDERKRQDIECNYADHMMPLMHAGAGPKCTKRKTSLPFCRLSLEWRSLDTIGFAVKAVDFGAYRPVRCIASYMRKKILSLCHTPGPWPEREMIVLVQVEDERGKLERLESPAYLIEQKARRGRRRAGQVFLTTVSHAFGLLTPN